MGVREKGVFARSLQPKSVCLEPWRIFPGQNSCYKHGHTPLPSQSVSNLRAFFLAKIPVINTCFPLFPLAAPVVIRRDIGQEQEVGGFIEADGLLLVPAAVGRDTSMDRWEEPHSDAGWLVVCYGVVVE